MDALEQGVEYLNDIQGFPEPAMYPGLARAKAKLIVMHSVQERGPAKAIDTDPNAIMGRLADFFDVRISALTAAGVPPGVAPEQAGAAVSASATNNQWTLDIGYRASAGALVMDTLDIGASRSSMVIVR